MNGRLFAVVGPSGAGKDTLIAALSAAFPRLHAARRVITRPEAPDSEPFEGVSPADFAARAAAGGFALTWRAHGLHYGIPVSVEAALARGQDALANLSRAALDPALS